jgi:WD40 repeat protein
VSTGKELANLTGPLNWLECCIFTPDGKGLLAGGGTNQTPVNITYWDLNAEQNRKVLEGHTAAVTFAAWSKDGKLLATTSWDKTIRVYDTTTWTLKSEVKCNEHTEGIRTVVFSPDEKLVATCSDDGTARLWDLSTGTLKTTIDGHGQMVYGVAFSPDGKLLATCGGDWKNPVAGKAKIWDVETGKLKQELSGLTRGVQWVTFTLDGKHLVGCGVGVDQKQPNLKVWEVEGGKEVRSMQVPSYVRYVAFSRDGKLLAGSLNNGEVKIWEFDNFRERLTIKAHQDLVMHVVFSPDGKMLATSGKDGNVKVWEMPGGGKPPAVATAAK